MTRPQLPWTEPTGMFNDFFKRVDRLERRARVRSVSRSSFGSETPESLYEAAGILSGVPFREQFVWTLTGPLVALWSPLFVCGSTRTLTSCVYLLDTAASVTGPTIRCYRDGVEIASEAMGTSAATTETTFSADSFTGDSTLFQFRISSLGDATARTLTAIARFS